MKEEKEKINAPGVLTLSIIFLAVFIIIWFVHLKWLNNLWTIR
jgi:hypothetical protein